MNAIFSLPLVIFCHIYRPHPHSNTMVSVPITVVLSQLPQIYRCPYPHAALYFQCGAAPLDAHPWCS